MNSKYLGTAFLSGSVWGFIGYVLGRSFMGSHVWGGVMAGPLIGVVIGVLWYPTYKWPTGIRVLVVLLSLYLGATLYGLAISVYSVTLGSPKEVWPAVIVEAIVSALMGTTMFIVILWPPLFLNYLLLGSLRTETNNA